MLNILHQVCYSHSDYNSNTGLNLLISFGFCGLYMSL